MAAWVPNIDGIDDLAPPFGIKAIKASELCCAVSVDELFSPAIPVAPELQVDVDYEYRFRVINAPPLLTAELAAGTEIQIEPSVGTAMEPSIELTESMFASCDVAGVLAAEVDPLLLLALDVNVREVLGALIIAEEPLICEMSVEPLIHMTMERPICNQE